MPGDTGPLLHNSDRALIIEVFYILFAGFCLTYEEYNMKLVKKLI